MQAYYHDARTCVEDLERQLALARDAITPPFHVSYMLGPDIVDGVRSEALGEFETAEEVDAVMAADIARRNGIDLDVVKKVQSALYRYRILAPPPF